MFKFIKSIFASERTAAGELTVQGAACGRATAAYAGDELRIAGGTAGAATIPLRDIKDLALSGTVLSFAAADRKYALSSPDAPALYKALHPLVYTSYLLEAPGLSYLVYNGTTRTFDPYEKPVTLRLYDDILYYMRIEDTDTIVHFEKIGTDTQYYIDDANLSFVWSTYSNCKFYTFCLRFKDPGVFAEFKRLYVELCYRSASAGEEYGQRGGLYGSMGAYRDDEPEDLLEESIKMDGASGGVAGDADASNKLLVVGNGQCYITRGTSLGVFDLSREDVKFRTHIRDALEDPVKAITHNGDANLLVLERGDDRRLGLMDLTRGEVVERWDMGTAVNDYFDSTKGSNDGTLVGLSDYSLFRIDPRAAERVVSRKEYKCRNEFSCGAATERGDVAVASRRGDLRLYDKIDKRAKTLLPGFGDAVLGVDISKDGGSVLCTYKSYLLLFRVDPNYSKNSKGASPIRLQLKPQHLSVLTDEISFSPAKFDLEDSVIITSTGRYIIKWRVADVLDGMVYNYTVKSLGEHVVDEDFIVDGSDVVVATRNNVRKIGEEELRRR